MLGLALTIAGAVAFLAEQTDRGAARPGDELRRGQATSEVGEVWTWRIVAGDGTPGLGPYHGQLRPPGLGLWDDATTVDSDDDLEDLAARLELTIGGLGPAL